MRFVDDGAQYQRWPHDRPEHRVTESRGEQLHFADLIHHDDLSCLQRRLQRGHADGLQHLHIHTVAPDAGDFGAAQVLVSQHGFLSRQRDEPEPLPPSGTEDFLRVEPSGALT